VARVPHGDRCGRDSKSWENGRNKRGQVHFKLVLHMDNYSRLLDAGRAGGRAGAGPGSEALERAGRVGRDS
jgi:hypothetical protein